MTQLCKFPMEYLRVTQKALSTYSHAGSLAMDFGGKDTGSDKLYAPFDFKVVRARQNANGELYIESTQPVQFADGTVDYCHLLFIHDGYFNVVEGETYPQGTHFYDEGGMGSGNPNAFGIHVHIEGGKGKWNSASQFKNANGTYVCENQYNLEKMFILGNDVQILDGQGYDWKRVSDIEASIPTPEPETTPNESEEIEMLNEKIQELNGLVDSLLETVKTQETTIAEKDSTIISLNAEIAKLNQQIEDLKNEPTVEDETIGFVDSIINKIKNFFA